MGNRILLGLDVESYYDPKSGYSLRKIDNPSYILDPRFEATMMAAKINNERSFPVDGPDIPRFLQSLGDPERYTLYGHNLMYDACVLSWRYGWNAGFNICTLACARQTIQKDLRSLSLDSVSRYFGFPSKGKTIDSVTGMRRADIIASGRWEEYLLYSCLDIELSYGILLKLLPLIPITELAAADIALRMATQPSLRLDREMLLQHINDVVAKKAQLMADAGAAKATLMSNDQLAELLISMGVDPPTKISAATQKETWAFAKNDEEFKALLDHHDPAVQAVIAARLGVKSTIEETRAARYYNCAGLDFHARGGVGLFPVPLKVSGAHTHRFSGDWKYNAQNLKRNVPRLGDAGRSKLRWSIMAPPGRKIVVSDKKQIEARMTATFCGQWDLVEQFRRGEDPYSIMATAIFGRPITKANEAERFCGKTLVLSAQYGVGSQKFRASIKHLAWEQAGLVIDLGEMEAEDYIQTYRAKTAAITAMRDYLGKTIIPMMAMPGCDLSLGPLRVTFERITLPGSLSLHYKNLRQRYDAERGSWEWVYDYAGITKRIYGGKLLENIIQYLAQVNIKQDMVRLQPLLLPYEIHIALQSHDELLLSTPVEHVDYTRHIVRQEMTRQVEWMPLLPVDCDVSGAVDRYGEAK